MHELRPMNSSTALTSPPVWRTTPVIPNSMILSLLLCEVNETDVICAGRVILRPLLVVCCATTVAGPKVEAAFFVFVFVPRELLHKERGNARDLRRRLHLPIQRRRAATSGTAAAE